MKLLRVVAIGSSLALLFGCVWFTQKQANPTMMPSSKLLVLPQETAKGTLIMPGSKSYTGATTISAEALRMQTGKQQSAKP
ncbi:MAG: autotransporter-associated beta strand repeat-containing protein [Prosthecobacter sp.]